MGINGAGRWNERLSYLPGEIRRSTEGNGNRRYTWKAALILRKSAEVVVAGKPEKGIAVKGRISMNPE